jgi:hypothetical protein
MSLKRAYGRGGWATTTLLLACAGACGNSSGDKPVSYTPVTATSDGNLYTLTMGDIKMVVDASTGARITELSLGGTNVLETAAEQTNYGSTYWPSPQSSWCAAGGGCWPPIAAIDSQPYSGSIDDAAKAINMASGAATIPTVADSALTIAKQFTPVPASGSIDVTYTLTNTSPSVSLSVAPWQVTRVAAGGITFFAPGTGTVTYQADSDPAFMTTAAAGDLWYQSAPVHHDSKAFADGTGWLAQATPDKFLFLTSFPDIQPTDAAPGESEIEFFTDSSYVELEDQGTYTALAPGQALTWTVRWKLRRLPSNASLTVGDPQLAAFATTTLAE